MWVGGGCTPAGVRRPIAGSCLPLLMAGPGLENRSRWLCPTTLHSVCPVPAHPHPLPGPPYVLPFPHLPSPSPECVCLDPVSSSCSPALRGSPVPSMSCPCSLAGTHQVLQMLTSSLKFQCRHHLFQDTPPAPCTPTASSGGTHPNVYPAPLPATSPNRLLGPGGRAGARSFFLALVVSRGLVTE